MEVEQAVRESRCKVAYRVERGRGIEFAGPHDDPEIEARIAGFRREDLDAPEWKAFRNCSLHHATGVTDWKPCLPKTAIDKLGDLYATT